MSAWAPQNHTLWLSGRSPPKHPLLHVAGPAVGQARQTRTLCEDADPTSAVQCSGGRFVSKQQE